MLQRRTQGQKLGARYKTHGPDEGNCFSNATKLCCTYFIYMVSTIAFLMGLAMCLYGYMSFT